LQKLSFAFHAANIIVGLSAQKHNVQKVSGQGESRVGERKFEKENMQLTYLTSLHIYSPYLPHTTQTGSPGSGKRCSLLFLMRSNSFMEP